MEKKDNAEGEFDRQTAWFTRLILRYHFLKNQPEVSIRVVSILRFLQYGT